MGPCNRSPTSITEATAPPLLAVAGHQPDTVASQDPTTEPGAPPAQPAGCPGPALASERRRRSAGHHTRRDFRSRAYRRKAHRHGRRGAGTPPAPAARAFRGLAERRRRTRYAPQHQRLPTTLAHGRWLRRRRARAAMAAAPGSAHHSCLPAAELAANQAAASRAPRPRHRPVRNSDDSSRVAA